MSSACEVFEEYTDRFIGYVIANPRLRSQIYDIDSFAKAMEKSLLSDPSLSNIPMKLKQSGESIEICGRPVFDSPEIQSLINKNIQSKKQQLRTKIKKDNPKLKGKKLNNEIERRFKISVGISAKRLPKANIQTALRTVEVSSYTRNGIKVRKSPRAKARKLNERERSTIESGIRKGKTPQQVINEYYNGGYKFRSKASIRTYYYRIKNRE